MSKRKPNTDPVVVDGVVQADFMDCKAVHSNGVYRLVFEVPAHGANFALEALGGLPDPGAPRRVAIALLGQRSPAASKPWPGLCPEASAFDGQRCIETRSGPSCAAHGCQRAVQRAAKEMKPRNRFTDLKPSAQAAMRCQEADFRAFLAEGTGHVIDTADDAAVYVREVCGVESRSELNDNPGARSAWERLEGDYFAWQRGML